MRELETSLRQFGEFLLKGAVGEGEGGAVLRALGAPIPDATGRIVYHAIMGDDLAVGSVVRRPALLHGKL